LTDEHLETFDDTPCGSGSVVLEQEDAGETGQADSCSPHHRHLVIFSGGRLNPGSAFVVELE